LISWNFDRRRQWRYTQASRLPGLWGSLLSLLTSGPYFVTSLSTITEGLHKFVYTDHCTLPERFAALNQGSGSGKAM